MKRTRRGRERREDRLFDFYRFSSRRSCSLTFDKNMKTNYIAIVSICILTLFQTTAQAGTKVVDWMHLNGILATIAADDYKAFCLQGTDQLKTNVSKETFAKNVSFLRPILLGGYHLAESGYTEKDIKNIYINWTLYYNSAKPKIVLRLDLDGPGGNVTNFTTE